MPPPADQLARFMQALGERESGNNYQAIGEDQGSKWGVAQGRYQIMSEIWPHWARDAGYAGANWRDPRAQDAVAAHRMARYYDKFNGDWSLVAAAWLGGEGAVEAIQTDGSGWQWDDGNVSVRNYVKDVMGNMSSTPGPSQGRRMQPGMPDGVSLEQHAVNAAQESISSAALDESEPPKEAPQVAAGVLGQLSQIAKSNADDPEVQARLQEAMRRVYQPRMQRGVF